MTSSFNYCKEFCMFEEEDKGFNTCGELSGYVKFEINNSLVNINIVVYNIKNNLSYQVYVMKESAGMVTSINVGSLSIMKNVASLTYEVSPNSKDILNFDAIAVLYIKNDGNFLHQ